MTNVLPHIFKAIALFTPGGDLIYGIDPKKQTQWHRDLCHGLQQMWHLADSPHFLVPGYTATVERWFNPQTQQIEIIAEAHPPVEQYIPLLQVLFNLESTVKWHIAPWQEEHCNRAVIETYKPHFPELWEQRDLMIRLDPNHSEVLTPEIGNLGMSSSSDPNTAISADNNAGYILRLFISGDRANAESILSSIHQLLERDLGSPYTLKVIDISKNPQQAEIHQIPVTPTLIKVAPKPTRRIVGQFDDLQRILRIITSF
ncbi:MAG: circadian clock KaiB family protein [Pleurocapsa sp. MO_226.B13]|nr:circadian clock KaiB family protein [Pleurocapsa sp. MO_226.B13]